MRALRSDRSDPSEPGEPEGHCRNFWRRIGFKKCCRRCSTCMGLLLGISLIAQIIGCIAFLVQTPTPSVSETAPRVAYWCLLSQYTILTDNFYRCALHTFSNPSAVPLGQAGRTHGMHLASAARLRGLGEPNSSIIVLEPGYMSVSATLFFIQQNLAKTTRVCIYDPLGVGFSDSTPLCFGPFDFCKPVTRCSLSGDGFGMIGFKSDAMAMKSVVDTELARAGGGLQVVVGGHSRGHLTACRFAVDYGHSYGGVSVLGFDGSWCGQRGGMRIGSSHQYGSRFTLKTTKQT